MKRTEEQWFGEALSGVEQAARPSDDQKERMLCNVLNASNLGASAWHERWVTLITVYPWRFAFGVSAVQAVLCTLIFGAKYTNLILGFMTGG